MMISTRRPNPLNFTTPLVLEPPRHSGLTPIPLIPGRHLIGSSPECAIQLHIEGVLDRHALILVGENRTVIKSMDPRTWVNDGPVAEMALRPGDRLSIGPLTFRVRSATAEEAEAFVVTPKVEHEPPRVEPQHVEPQRVDSKQSPREFDSVGSGRSDVPVVATAPTRTVDRTDSSDRAVLDSRLEEIQRQLTELRITTDSVVQPVEPEISLVQAEIAHRSHQMDLRAQELQRRADQIAAETQRLQGRVDHVSARESQLELREHQLVQEAERIAEVTQSTRRTLAEEHARHVAIWQEWEASYLRMTGEIAAQLDAIEKHRESLQVEADRLAVARTELQRLRTQQDHDRQLYAVDLIKLASDRAELASLRSELERQRDLWQHEADEGIRQRDASQREMVLRQEELASATQQLESERQTLMTEWSEQVKRIELENQRRAAAQLAIDEDRQRLQNERDELSTLKSELARQQTLLDLDRSQIELARIEAERSLVERQSLEERCRQADIELAELRRIEAEYSEFLMTRAIEPQTPSGNSGDVRPSPAAPAAPAPVASDLGIAALPILLSGHELPAATVPIEVTTPPAPVPSFPDASGGFGLAVDWSTLVAKEHEFACAKSDIAAPEPEREPIVADVLVTERASETTELSSETVNPSAVVSETQADVLAIESPANLSPVPALTSPWPCPSVDLDRSLAAVLTPSPVDAALSAVDPWGAYPLVESAVPGSEQLLVLESEASGRLAKDLVVRSSVELGASSHVSGNSAFESHFPEQETNCHAGAEHGLTAGETLTEVNRQFGSPVEGTSMESASEMPSWWVESSPSLASDAGGDGDGAGDAEHANTLNEEPTSETNPESFASAFDPVDDLRAKLAAMFDLSETTTSASDHENASDDPNEFDATSRGTANELTDPPRVMTLAEVRGDAASAATASESPAETAARDGDAHVEDSVETFMARLLARSRTGSGESDSPGGAPAGNQGSTADSVRRETEQRVMESMVSKVAATDRSHLMEEPKHKQDRQAVRENLQSFRQVAHLSARSALARHSLEQLRNATIAKGLLLGISAAAVSYFLAQPLWGGPLQLWKTAGCALATLLAAMEFNRSWSRLMTPLKAPPELAPNADVEASVDPEASVDGEANVEPAGEGVAASEVAQAEPDEVVLTDSQALPPTA
jgi:hypothetical protein